jgi:hypothetical protein
MLVPVAAIVDGVKIEFYPEEHPPPHFHARYAEFAAQIEIRTSRVLRGSLPPAKLSRVLSLGRPTSIGAHERLVRG